MHEPLKVLHVITTTDRGGAEAQLLRLISHSPTLKLSHHVVCLRPRGVLADEIETAGSTLECLDLSPQPSRLWGGMRRLQACLEHMQPDIIQSWLYHANLLALLAKPADGPPLLWSLHSSKLGSESLGRYTRLVMYACRRLSKRPQAIMANSEEGRRYHQDQGYPSGHFHVIPNGFDPDIFKPDQPERAKRRVELGLNDDRVLVGLVARFDPVKNLPGFLKAAALARAQRPQLAFLLLGSGVIEDNPALASALSPPLRGHCFLLGESNQVPAWLAAMDVHASFSNSEGFSNAIGEAMAAGLPQIVSDVGDSALLNGECGEVIPAGDEAALAKAMVSMVDLGAEGRASLGALARQRIKDHFSLANNVAAYYDLYRQICTQRPKERPAEPAMAEAQTGDRLE